MGCFNGITVMALGDAMSFQGVSFIALEFRFGAFISGKSIFFKGSVYSPFSGFMFIFSFGGCDLGLAFCSNFLP